MSHLRKAGQLPPGCLATQIARAHPSEDTLCPDGLISVRRNQRRPATKAARNGDRRADSTNFGTRPGCTARRQSTPLVEQPRKRCRHGYGLIERLDFPIRLRIWKAESRVKLGQQVPGCDEDVCVGQTSSAAHPQPEPGEGVDSRSHGGQAWIHTRFRVRGRVESDYVVPSDTSPECILLQIGLHRIF